MNRNNSQSIFQENNIGFLLETQDYFIFFGKQAAQFSVLKNEFPQFKFSRIHQVHGNLVVHSGAEDEVADEIAIKKADAQWTKTKSLALCISTADCIPIFLVNPIEKTIAAIHAGWKGVASKILHQTIASMHLGKWVKDVQFFIGPHIQFFSFEVENHLKDHIFSSLREFSSSFFQPTSEGKCFVDLNLVIQRQLIEIGVPLDNISNFKLDTRTDLRFHSHRRDREKAGRQISFIALKPSVDQK